MLLEGTASYATLPMLFFGHFLVVTSVTFNNSLSNFEQKKKTKKNTHKTI